jgi:hypothetical protein
MMNKQLKQMQMDEMMKSSNSIVIPDVLGGMMPNPNN